MRRLSVEYPVLAPHIFGITASTKVLMDLNGMITNARLVKTIKTMLRIMPQKNTPREE